MTISFCVLFILATQTQADDFVLHFIDFENATFAFLNPNLPNQKQITITSSQGVNLLSSVTLSGSPFTYAPNLDSTTTVVSTRGSSTVTITIDQATAFLIYAYDWPQGRYTISPAVNVRTNNYQLMGLKSQINVNTATKFQGILEMNNPSNRIVIKGTPLNPTVARIKFTLGKKVTTTPTPTAPIATAAPGTDADVVHWEFDYNGWWKCYQMSSEIYGIHYPQLDWIPGPCNRTFYTRPDCFWDHDVGHNGETYYVYRYWQTGAPCPQTQCCCGDIPAGDPSPFAHCADNTFIALGYTQSCAVIYAPPTVNLTHWKKPCST